MNRKVNRPHHHTDRQPRQSRLGRARDEKPADDRRRSVPCVRDRFAGPADAAARCERRAYRGRSHDPTPVGPAYVDVTLQRPCWNSGRMTQRTAKGPLIPGSDLYHRRYRRMICHTFLWRGLSNLRTRPTNPCTETRPMHHAFTGGPILLPPHMLPLTINTHDASTAHALSRIAHDTPLTASHSAHPSPAP